MSQRRPVVIIMGELKRVEPVFQRMLISQKLSSMVQHLHHNCTNCWREPSLNSRLWWKMQQIMRVCLPVMFIHSIINIIIIISLLIIGCDRHFLGMYMICQEEGLELPSIFADPAFIRSGGGGNYILSTSCAGYWSFAGGVPPMIENGYGCFYGIEDNRLTFTITDYKRCHETESNAFYNNIKLSLKNMHNILTSGSKL